MSDVIIYVDRSEIREGRFEELEEAIGKLAHFIETNEPRLIAYEVYFSEDREHMTVVHVHPDAESLEFHMETAGHLFPKFAEYVRMERIDVYGEPGEHIVQRLRQKAESLGSGTVQVHSFHTGFARFADD